MTFECAIIAVNETLGGDKRVFRHTPVPVNYPTSDKWDPNYEGYPNHWSVPKNYVIGLRLTFAWMKAAVITAMHHLAANGGRGKGIMELYLHTCCIAD